VNEYTNKINNLKTILENAKAEKIRAEQNVENLNKRKAELKVELEGLGITSSNPDEIKAELAGMEQEIQTDIVTIEGLIPEQYRQNEGDKNGNRGGY
jgi:uncharacterized protein involved in exopolysaccharide biosynthesis